MKEVFVFLSAVLILFAGPLYVVDTIRGKARPERVTWFVFSVLGVIAFASQIYLGASWSLVFSGLDTAASITIFTLSIWRGVGGHTKLDIAALLIAAVGVTIAIAAKQPIISLLGVILADIAGTVLSVRKAYIEPQSETSAMWLLTGTAALFGCLTVSKFSVAILLYPFYLMTANYAVPIAQVVGRAVHGSVRGRFKG